MVDGFRGGRGHDLRDPAERDPLAARTDDGQRRQRGRVGAALGREAQHHGKAAGAVEQFGDLAAGDRRLYQLLDVADVEPVAGEGVPVDPDFELRRPREHLHLGVGGARHLLDDPEHLDAQTLEHCGVGAEDLDRHVRLDPGDDLVEPHRHRLGEVHRKSGNLRER